MDALARIASAAHDVADSIAVASTWSPPEAHPAVRHMLTGPGTGYLTQPVVHITPGTMSKPMLTKFASLLTIHLPPDFDWSARWLARLALRTVSEGVALACHYTLPDATRAYMGSNISLVQVTGGSDRWLLTGDDGAFTLLPTGRQADGSFLLTLRLVLQCSFVHEADARPWITLVKQAVVRRADAYCLSFQLLRADASEVGYIAAPPEQYLLTTSIPPQVYDLRVMRDGTLSYVSRDRTNEWMNQERTTKPQHIPFNTVRLVDGATGAPLARPPPELVVGSGDAEWSRSAMVALPAMAWAPREWYGDGVEEEEAGVVAGSPTLPGGSASGASSGGGVPMEDDAMDGLALPPAAPAAAAVRPRKHRRSSATAGGSAPSSRSRRLTDVVDEADVVMRRDGGGGGVGSTAADSDCTAGASDDESEATVSLPADDQGHGRSRRDSIISTSHLGDHEVAGARPLLHADHTAYTAPKPPVYAAAPAGTVFITPDRLAPWFGGQAKSAAGGGGIGGDSAGYALFPVTGAVPSPNPFAMSAFPAAAYGPHFTAVLAQPAAYAAFPHSEGGAHGV